MQVASNGRALPGAPGGSDPGAESGHLEAHLRQQRLGVGDRNHPQGVQNRFLEVRRGRLEPAPLVGRLPAQGATAGAGAQYGVDTAGRRRQLPRKRRQVANWRASPLSHGVGLLG